ncbi:MAG TPA: UDP-glucose 4-epimerase GalE, partial [Rugosimonospora sp.]
RCLVAWLVTGGAGYIGAPVVRALLDSGRPVVVLDDLSSGDLGTVPPEVPLVRASVGDTAAVRHALAEYGVTGVVHLAGRKSVVESLARPLTYYHHNVGGTQALIEAMAEAGVEKMVFSSSAAVYGNPEGDLVSEDAALEPLNPYGATKLVCEWIMSEAARVHGLKPLVLRYFNVAGASMIGRPRPADIGLVGRAVDSVARGAQPVVYGRDYPTPDGSCVRDFVHVLDVASAHVLAADALDTGLESGVYNVGCGIGYSVGQVFDRIREVTGVGFEEEARPRRGGDPVRVVASIERIGRGLGWRPRHDLTDIVRSQWQAHLGAAHLGTAPQARPLPVGARAGGIQSAGGPAGTGGKTDTRGQPAQSRGDERPARIQVISASIGAGHDGAARELAGRLTERGFQVECMDLISVFPGWLGPLLRGMYRRMLTRRPRLYDSLFRIACTFNGAAPITRALLRPMRRRLLRRLPPDARAVVSTFPLGAQILGPLRLSRRLTVPAITYLTDFGVHPIWVSPGVDMHCAGHEVTRTQARDLGAGDTRVVGRLVSPLYRPATRETKREARQRLGLPASGRFALLVAGSWGVGELVETAAEVAGSGAAMPVVVCGNNAEMYRAARSQGVGHVFGWVEDMPAILQAVDVLVENAGGLTALEAMACGVPVATYRAIPGHGTQNAEAMVQAGVTHWIHDRESLGPALTELIDGGTDLQQCQAALALFESDPATVVADLAKAGFAEQNGCADKNAATERGLAEKAVAGKTVAGAGVAGAGAAARAVAAGKTVAGTGIAGAGIAGTGIADTGVAGAGFGGAGGPAGNNGGGDGPVA